jgi:cell division transport system permease protein
MFTSFKRIIVLGWQNLARESSIAAANVLIIMIPVLLVASLFLIGRASDFLVKELQAKADISIRFNESVAEDDILRVKDEIGKIEGIGGVEYVSKDQALEVFKGLHQNDAVLMETLSEINGNPLPASLHVAAASAAQFDRVSELLGGDDYKDMVYSLDYNEQNKKEAIRKIFSFAEDAKKTGLALFVVLGVISVMVTFNTVRMAIFTRKREIGIQRLVGASRWFIRGQFLVEGLIFGVLAAAFSFLAVAAVCWYVSPGLAKIMPGFDLWAGFSVDFWRLLAIQLAAGAGLGVFSSLIAVSRYLKV